jgi:hypothetical protein
VAESLRRSENPALAHVVSIRLKKDESATIEDEKPHEVSTKGLGVATGALLARRQDAKPVAEGRRPMETQVKVVCSFDRVSCLAPMEGGGYAACCLNAIA